MPNIGNNTRNAKINPRELPVFSKSQNVYARKYLGSQYWERRYFRAVHIFAFFKIHENMYSVEKNFTIQYRWNTMKNVNLNPLENVYTRKYLRSQYLLIPTP